MFLMVSCVFEVFERKISYEMTIFFFFCNNEKNSELRTKQIKTQHSSQIKKKQNKTNVTAKSVSLLSKTKMNMGIITDTKAKGQKLKLTFKSAKKGPLNKSNFFVFFCFEKRQVQTNGKGHKKVSITWMKAQVANTDLGSEQLKAQKQQKGKTKTLPRRQQKERELKIGNVDADMDMDMNEPMAIQTNEEEEEINITKNKWNFNFSHELFDDSNTMGLEKDNGNDEFSSGLFPWDFNAVHSHHKASRYSLAHDNAQRQKHKHKHGQKHSVDGDTSMFKDVKEILFKEGCLFIFLSLSFIYIHIHI
ncbi:hypothetical protein RFI_13546 [Reticulomyxa filosa]|uniref:Uncharacterized protein n=1 Tax=Reticulomyxa filosa TaxID=46433 RepID=X6NBG6_RETFI|nr:hypothetical protein RFI_13546 [Reticulomyxa filosa]|eukprot:ETO23635.1 hypothetical protein RFI_13546 [Reticulomyxa filosa]